jgi:hypothetical protein
MNVWLLYTSVICDVISTVTRQALTTSDKDENDSEIHAKFQNYNAHESI